MYFSDLGKDKCGNIIFESFWLIACLLIFLFLCLFFKNWIFPRHCSIIIINILLFYFIFRKIILINTLKKIFHFVNTSVQIDLTGLVANYVFKKVTKIDLFTLKHSSLHFGINRSICPEVLFKREFHKIYRKTPVLKSLFNKIAGPMPATLIKRDSNTGVFL